MTLRYRSWSTAACAIEGIHGTKTVCEIPVGRGHPRTVRPRTGSTRLGRSRARYPLAPAEGCGRMLDAYARVWRHERDPPDARDRSGQGETGDGASPGSLRALGEHRSH